MRFLVVGAGSWGTAFTRILLDRQHEVVLACHSPEQAEAIASTGWNPRYLQGVDLSAAEAAFLAGLPKAPTRLDPHRDRTAAEHNVAHGA